MTEQERIEQIEKMMKEHPELSRKEIEEGMGAFSVLDTERDLFKKELQRVVENTIKRCQNQGIPAVNVLQVMSDTMTRESLSFTRAATQYTNNVMQDMQNLIKQLRN